MSHQFIYKLKREIKQKEVGEGANILIFFKDRIFSLQNKNKTSWKENWKLEIEAISSRKE